MFKVLVTVVVMEEIEVEPELLGFRDGQEVYSQPDDSRIVAEYQKELPFPAIPTENLILVLERARQEWPPLHVGVGTVLYDPQAKVYEAQCGLIADEATGSAEDVCIRLSRQGWKRVAAPVED